jgi:hypothetical protein
MNVFVDETSEQRIKREIELGHFKTLRKRSPMRSNCLTVRKPGFKIKHSFSPLERGEGIQSDEARRILEARKQRR